MQIECVCNDDRFSFASLLLHYKLDLTTFRQRKMTFFIRLSFKFHCKRICPTGTGQRQIAFPATSHGFSFLYPAPFRFPAKTVDNSLRKRTGMRAVVLQQLVVSRLVKLSAFLYTKKTKRKSWAYLFIVHYGVVSQGLRRSAIQSSRNYKWRINGQVLSLIIGN